jgi:hypothetical protein
MKKTSLIVLVFILSVSGLYAQGRNGLMGHRRASDSGSDFFSFLKFPNLFNGLNSNIPGNMYVFTSISPYSAFILGDMDKWSKGTNLMGTLGFRQMFSNNLGYKAAIHYGHFQGEDSAPLNYRNGSFNANILEFSAQCEYTIWGGPFSADANPNSVYAFLGIGLLHSAANAQANNQSYGPTSVIAPFIALGLGYQYALNEKYSLGAEIGAQCPVGSRKILYKANADLLDGYSPLVSGNKSNDVVAFFALTFTYKFYEGRNY